MTTTALTSWVADEFGVEVRTVSSSVGLVITDLVGLALRRNPRRAHLLVSTVLGKHLAVDPDLVIGTGRLLGELVARALGTGVSVNWSTLAEIAVQVGDPAPLNAALDTALSDRSVHSVVVLGFAETATGLGHLVADQVRARCYLHSTRRDVPGVEIAGTFEEGHSHATSHLLLPLPTALIDTDEPMVLVDDELSTGRTAMGTIAEVHRRHPRSRYVVATLIDLRSPSDEAEMRLLAESLGARIDVVALVRGSVVLPGGLIGAVSDRLVGLDRGMVSAPPPPSPGSLHRSDIGWPVGVPDGGRHGFLSSDRPAFDRALTVAACVVGEAVRSHPAVRDRAADSSRVGTSRADTSDGKRVGTAEPDALRIIVVGTEELMYLPLRLAQQLRREPHLSVRFQSTTRSPVFVLDDLGYPIRRHFTFADAEGNDSARRHLYNCSFPMTDGSAVDPDLVVVVTDSPADTELLCSPDGLIGALRAAGLPVELVVLSPVDLVALAHRRSAISREESRPGRPLPAPLTGPDFGTYAADEVSWLLTDLSDVDLEADVADREAAIQAGTAHYAESLPVEYQPDTEYQELFASVLAESSYRLATAVGLVTELVLRERGHDVVFASLARAGTPIGILMRRWAAFRHGLTIPHYAISIVRGRGIDTAALKYLGAHDDPSKVVFVDGWTGKGAIAKELSSALEEFTATDGVEFSADLAVLADPGFCVRTFGTRDDFLIASACLNSTVSGLVSRTVLNQAYLVPGEFHGAKFYRELSGIDVSTVLLDAVSAAFPTVVDAVLSDLPDLAASDRDPTFTGWAAIETIRAEYGIESVNFVKPGVGETTRVLLRRVPWRILVREVDNPDHEHLRHLAAQRGVPVEVRPDLPYSCVGLIRRLSQFEPGEA